MALDVASFDPVRLARYEKDNYVFYYRRRWLRLLVVSVKMVQEAYQLSLFQAIRGAYLVARAEMAFAPHPNNDVPRATATMRRFYALLQRAHGWRIDLDRAAELELNWWIVHRRLFADEQNQELVDALAALLVHIYGIDPALAGQAAALRARAMLYSDRWVRQGLNPNSPLLAQEEELLCEGCRVLKTALETRRQVAW
jgi:hypothetical protein